MTEEAPYNAAGMTPAWRDTATEFRKALALLKVHTMPCMPGESHYCGADYGHHAYSLLAALVVRVEELRTSLVTTPEEADKFDKLLQGWRADFADAEKRDAMSEPFRASAEAFQNQTGGECMDRDGQTFAFHSYGQAGGSCVVCGAHKPIIRM